MNKKWFFSLKSGDLYQVDTDEAKILDGFQIPLKDRPGSCKKCHGRFYTGFLTTNQIYEICQKCGRKLIDHQFIKDVAHNK